jgi:hypothetical protein
MTDEPKAVVPTEEKTIVFYDDELQAVKLESGEILVPVRRLCDNLGLSWAGQRERINRHEVLSEELKTVRVTRTVKEGGRGGGQVDTLCLPLDKVPGWLFGIQAGRVKEVIRPKLIRYQRECFRVLWDAFKADVIPQIDPELAPPAATPAEQNLAHIEALYNLARQQVAFERAAERWLVHHDQRLDTVEDLTLDAHSRIDALELTIAAGPTVTTAQAAAISGAVKALAAKLGEVEPEKGNPYGRVYGRLYRVFSVSSYKAIPLETFPAVMTWLADWWGDIAGDDPAPFGVRDVGGQLGMEL